MPPLLNLSQGQLNTFSQCPRKFQYLYLDSLTVPPDPQQQLSLAWGSQFHLLMQQRELALPVETLQAETADLQAAMAALVAAAPEVLAETTEPPFRQSEHRRTLAFDGYLLTVIYDLLLLSATQGQILDWKTHLVPRNPDRLAQDWQTRLYLYVLAETTDLSPAALSMTYWFVRCQDPQTQALAPQRVVIPYSAPQHDRTRADLTQLLSQLSQTLAAARTHDQPFPQVDLSQGLCHRCPFALRCDRSPAQTTQAAIDPWDLSTIPEISL